MTNTYNTTSFIWKGSKNHNFLLIAILLHALIIGVFSFEKQDNFEPISFGVQFSVSSFSKNHDVSNPKHDKIITTKNDNLAHENHEHDDKDSQKISEEQNSTTNGDDSSMVEYIIGSSENPAPQYPILAKRNELEGVSKICAEIDGNGFVKSANVCGSSGYQILDNSALSAVKNWKFKIKQAGKNVYNVSVNINFTLK